MTVDKLDENKVLIVLCSKDMEDYRLDFTTMSLDDVHSRKILLKIMQLACIKSGIQIKGRNIKLEAMKLDDGCYILITVDFKEEKHRTHTYKIKKTGSCLCYSFGNGGDFLDTIEILYRMNVCCNKNCAYVYNNKYYIIFEYPSIPQKLRHVLSEYGKKTKSTTFIARIRENGKILCKYNAIASIGKHLV